MFEKVAIVNRGEIGIRIERALRELRGANKNRGYKSLALFSEIDEGSRLVNYADDRALIGPAPAKESYLNIPVIIEKMIEKGADAAHPGYGFLAESEEFRRACDKAGITFIGPSAEVIGAMGSKNEAKKIMKSAGIPVIPGSDVPITNIDDARAIGSEIGYPYIVKPMKGGGGKGMGVVWKESDLETVFDTAQRIGSSAFGSSDVLIEAYLSDPRHIEFQIEADNYGNIIHICERECTLQRYHQKVMEMCPSPIMTPELREKMGNDAIKAAKAIGYNNLGTIEFLLLPKGKYFYIETNPRIQVEVPVTEEAIRAAMRRIDLVKDQIKIADGEKINYDQSEIRPVYYAVECRINAEDSKTFAPRPGKIKRYRSSGGPGIRVDSGIGAGDEIPPFYDSLIVKIVATDNTYIDALIRMSRALDETVIEGSEGLATNKSFLKALVNNEYVRKGDFSTTFIEKHSDELSKEVDRILAIEEAFVKRPDLDPTNVVKSPNFSTTPNKGVTYQPPSKLPFTPDPHNPHDYLRVIKYRATEEPKAWIEMRDIWRDISGGTQDPDLVELSLVQKTLAGLKEEGLVELTHKRIAPIGDVYALTDAGEKKVSSLLSV